MTIIAIGPHPDDPEEGAGGTLARLMAMHEKLIIIYMNNLTLEEKIEAYPAYSMTRVTGWYVPKHAMNP